MIGGSKKNTRKKKNKGGIQTMEQLLALIPKVQNCRESLRSQEVGNALYGLQHLSDSRETRRLLVVLTPKVEECRLDHS